MPKIVAQYRKVYGGSETLRYFATDHLGSRRVSYSSSSGDAVDKFTYSAYGQYSQTQGASAFLASFTGKEYDQSSLLYFNARYYDAEIGRFLQEDPSQGGENWYVYCDNDPINTIDPDGKDPQRVSTSLLGAEAPHESVSPGALRGRAEQEWQRTQGDILQTLSNVTGMTGKWERAVLGGMREGGVSERAVNAFQAARGNLLQAAAMPLTTAWRSKISEGMSQQGYSQAAQKEIFKFGGSVLGMIAGSISAAVKGIAMPSAVRSTAAPSGRGGR